MRPDPPAPALRLGILLDGRRQPRWVAEAIALALAVPGVKLAAIALLHGLAPPRPARLYALVQGVERRLQRRDERLFGQTDLAARLRAPRVAVRARQEREGWSLDAPAAARLGGCGVDLWFCFTGLPARRPLPAIAARGVWSLEIGGRPATQAWAGATEILAASPVTMTALADYLRPSGTDVYRSFGTTIGSSPRRNRACALTKGLRLFARLLDAMRRNGQGRAPPPASRPPLRAPTPAAVTRLCGRIAANVTANRWAQLRFREQWRIAYCFFDGAGRPPHWRYLIPPPDRLWADPFVIAHEGRHVVFFEELVDGSDRGRIMAVALDAEADPAPPVVALERPYHLSYPFLFRWNGALYLLPETGANRTVELYRCERFPARWRLERVLLDGIAAYDATLHQAGGAWWMFVNVAEPGADCNDELHLYRADSPLGPWAAHPANPVVSDVRRARPAGPLFARDGALYRPSQDSSRHYGEAIVINRVDALDEHQYRETPVLRLQPARRHDLRGVHTLGGDGRVGVLDFLVRRRRW